MGQPALVPHVNGSQTTLDACRQRVNDTIEKLQACVRRDSLWQLLSQFQRIADANPGPQGHGNRDTGTPGYAASVAYVAKLMRNAGYQVTIQQYIYTRSDVAGTPFLRAGGKSYQIERDWFLARQSGAGRVIAPLEPPRTAEGCAPRDYQGFARGNIALIQESSRCDADVQVSNARAAGAGAAILYRASPYDVAGEARLLEPAAIPVAGFATRAMADELLHRLRGGGRPVAAIEVRVNHKSDVDYNVIADSPYGDPQRVVVVDAHLDAIYGAGMLDNASGSTTILDVALNMAKAKTRNHLRYIWFGGEELGLLGSRYYTKHLSRAELRDIAFDVDADVTATPNFDILIADPQFARKAKRFPPNVIPESRLGNDYFTDFFEAGGVISRAARFGNDGTDSFAFALAGVPDTGILTEQDCCKRPWETKLWGGYRGNYEGKIPSFNGGCVDHPHRWCDNLSNNDPFVLELATKAVAYVTFALAQHRFGR